MLLVILIAVFVYHSVLLYRRSSTLSAEAVMVKKAESKFEPSLNATTHFKLSEGSKVKILDEQGIWFKIKRRDGKVGWVEEGSL